jgi:hypothetical protein
MIDACIGGNRGGARECREQSGERVHDKVFQDGLPGHA